MLNGKCHCGAVEISYDGAPKALVRCNCSICRRLNALWGHGPEGTITVKGAKDATRPYTWGDKTLEFHSCTTCGCTTHWRSRGTENPRNMAMNMALADPADIADLRVRHFDGADSWTFFD